MAKRDCNQWKTPTEDSAGVDLLYALSNYLLSLIAACTIIHKTRQSKTLDFSANAYEQKAKEENYYS